MKLLIRHGADPNKNNPLCFAAFFGKVAAAQLLLEYNVDINQFSEKWMSSLIAAVDGNRPDVVKLLVENGADLTVQHENLTAQARARKLGRTNIVEMITNEMEKRKLRDVEKAKNKQNRISKRTGGESYSTKSKRHLTNAVVGGDAYLSQIAPWQPFLVIVLLVAYYFRLVISKFARSQLKKY